ncbi:MAG: alpha-amylase [Muribaculaceae bacterium]|nr:alpha-amylase [Muribaculaceae bacterium]
MNFKSIFRNVAVLCAALGLAAPAQAAAPTTVKHPEWAKNAVIYEVNTRQFTPEGTFKAMGAHLDRLKDLGVDILWFMPIHPISEKNRKGKLGSYYAVKDYTAVNPEFGTLDDFKSLVGEAHKRGMKVLLDWVPNHTGCDNAWVTEHPEYYALDNNGKMFGPFDWTDTYKLDYSKPATRAAMISSMLFWLIEADIDGFRCDVASEVPVDFWNEARPVLQAAKPELFMLAEASVPALEEHAFDMAYNWPMKDLFSAIAATSGQYTFVAPGATEPRKFQRAVATDIATLHQQQQTDYPAGAYMMNMITNHDLNSWEGTEFERLGSLTPAFAVLSFTLPGMPLLYTGQEVGLNRAFEFFEKDKAPDWKANDFTEFYKMLTALKHSRPELNIGEGLQNMIVYSTVNPDLLVFERRAGKSATLVIVNLGKKSAKMLFNGAEPDFKEFRKNPLASSKYSNNAVVVPYEITPGEYFVYTTD